MDAPVVRCEESIPDLIDSLAVSTSDFGASHPRTLAVANQLATALWAAGDVQQAIGLLEQALETISLHADHPVRSDLLCTLAEILAGEGQWERAAAMYREVLASCVRRFGECAASAVAAKADLAAVLFELGQAREAAELEREASEIAGKHLGRTHPVTCVLAWNRALRLEGGGDGFSAHKILIDELAWLLSADDAHLREEHHSLKAMLARRLERDTALFC